MRRFTTHSIPQKKMKNYEYTIEKDYSGYGQYKICRLSLMSGKKISYHSTDSELYDLFRSGELSQNRISKIFNFRHK
jgi:hypothetical protein